MRDIRRQAREQIILARGRVAGFEGVEVEPWRVYQVDDARAFLTDSGVDVEKVAPQIEGRFASAFVRGRKPQSSPCCAPGCCA